MYGSCKRLFGLQIRDKAARDRRKRYPEYSSNRHVGFLKRRTQLYKTDIFSVQIGCKRYFFNVRDSLGLIRHEEGSELGGITAARQEAVDSARNFAMDDLRCGNAIQARNIEITDEESAVLGRAAISRSAIDPTA